MSDKKKNLPQEPMADEPIVILEADEPIVILEADEPIVILEADEPIVILEADEPIVILEADEPTDDSNDAENKPSNDRDDDEMEILANMEV